MAVAVNGQTTTRIDTRSSIASDSSVEAFLQPDFDPIDHLNSALPSLSVNVTARTGQSGQYGRAVSLPELSSQLQTLLSQLNAQTTRLSNTLTQLTDEIVRSGGRLAYEVEVLRGETIALQDSLGNEMRADIDVFAPASVQAVAVAPSGDATLNEVADAKGDTTDSETLQRLGTLTTVRSRLDSVVKVFGDAMLWPLAPSELSVASSLISVSAPTAGDDSQTREEKGKAYVEKLRKEIADLLGSGNDSSGVEAASARIEELRQLAEVWKGTSEEKARLRLIESLQKPVEEKQKAMDKTSSTRRLPTPARGIDYRYGNGDSTRLGGDVGYGFLQNLRGLKSDT